MVRMLKYNTYTEFWHSKFKNWLTLNQDFKKLLICLIFQTFWFSLMFLSGLSVCFRDFFFRGRGRKWVIYSLCKFVTCAKVYISEILQSHAIIKSIRIKQNFRRKYYWLCELFQDYFLWKPTLINAQSYGSDWTLNFLLSLSNCECTR